MGTDPAPRGGTHDAEQPKPTRQVHQAQTQRENVGGRKKKERIFPLSAYRSPLARPPVPQSEGISSPLLLLLFQGPLH